MMPPNPHRPGSPESLERELADLRTRAQGERDAARFFLVGLVHEARMELGQPSRMQERMRTERVRLTVDTSGYVEVIEQAVRAMARILKVPPMMQPTPDHPLPVTCHVCTDGLHHDDGLMCPRHEGALTHHYCNNGCPECGRLRKERAA